jgi:tetratricopeptide (TPR) repeat protein
MRGILVSCLVLLASFGADMHTAVAGGQGYPGGGGQMPGGRPGMGSGMQQPGNESISSTPATEKPDAAAKKAFTAGVKSLNRAREYEEAAAKAPNPDKKAAALDKVSDAYGKALDQFTETLRNKGDMFEAWNYVGYIHLRLGAYNESIDDYNHTLALKPELLEAIEHRAVAYMAVDRLEDAKAAYMDLFNHERPLADQLMVSMQSWLESHRAAANGMRAADIDAFDKWLQERGGIAKQTASTSAAAPVPASPQ